jgi:hypothetical protein
MRDRDPESAGSRPVFASEHGQPRRSSGRLSKLETRALDRATSFYQHQEEGIATWSSSVTADWTTKRGLHLTHEGRFWARVFGVFAVLGFFGILLVPGRYQDLPDAIFAAGLMVAFGVAMGAIRNWFQEQLVYSDSETARFRLELSAASARLTKDLPNSARQVQEILRTDAGSFLVHFGGFGLGQRPAWNRRIDYVYGWSRDGRSSIQVPNVIWEKWLHREGDRFRMARSPAEMLGLWWPFTPDSALAQGLLLANLPPVEVW